MDQKFALSHSEKRHVNTGALPSVGSFSAVLSAFLLLLMLASGALADVNDRYPVNCGTLTNVCTVRLPDNCPAPNIERTFGGYRFCISDPTLSEPGPQLIFGDQTSGTLPVTTQGQAGESLGVPSCSDPESQGRSLIANPINPATQNKVERAVDYVGPGRLPISLVRTFNSASINNNASTPFGKKWTLGFARLDSWVPPSSSGATKGLINTRPDGQRVRYYHRTDATTGFTYYARSNGKLARILKSDVDGSWVFLDGVVEERYDNSGRISLTTNSSGEYLKYSYPVGNSLYPIRVDHSSGRYMRLEYASNGRILRAILPDGNIVNYSHDSRGNLKTVSQPDVAGQTATATYYYQKPDRPDSITQFRNSMGKDTFWTYDSFGKATSSSRTSNVERTQVISTGSSNGVTSVTTRNALGKDTTYRFQDIGGNSKLIAVDGAAKGNCAASNQSMTYDVNGYYDLVTDREGNIVDYDYNDLGLLERKTEAPNTTDERITTYEYHPILELPLLIDTPFQTTEHEYDDRGRVTLKKVTNKGPNGVGGQVRQWTYTYGLAAANSEGTQLVVSVTVDGPRTDVTDTTQINYDSQGRLTSVVNAKGHATTFTNFDAAGRPRQIIRPTGMVTNLEYHPRGWVTKKTESIYTRRLNGTWFTQNRVTNYSYYKNGQLKRVTYPDGAYFDFWYDSYDRLFRVDNNDMEMKWFDYDLASNVIKERVRHEETTTTWQAVCCTPWGEPELQQVTTTQWLTDKETSYGYDALSRLESITNGNGNTSIIRYNRNDLANLVKDAKNNQTTTTFNKRNQAKTVNQPDGGVVNFGYDADAMLGLVTDPIGATSGFERDGFGDPDDMPSADAGIESLTYDSAGNVKTYTDGNGKTTTYNYDVLNRVVREDFQDGTANLYWYDNDRPGYLYRAAEMVGSTVLGDTKFWRNRAGEIVSKQSTVGGQSMISRFEYDVAGRVDRILYPGGTTVDYDFDSVGRVSGIKASHASFSLRNVLSGIEYMPYGPVHTYLFGSGERRTYDYDGDYRLDQLVSGNVMAKTYGHDDNDNITSIVDGVGNVSRTYDYDTMDRLDYHTGPDGTFSYVYDDNGNRKQKQRYGVSTTYNYPAGTNRLTGVSGAGGHGRSVDLAGNTTSIGGATLSYNARNLFSRYTHSNGTITDYTYNSFGERVRKKRGSFDQRFDYGSGTRLMHERGSQGTIDYIYLSGKPVAIVRNGSLYYIHNDHLGRPEAMTNAASQKVWGITANAFSSDGSTGSFGGFNLRFPGQYYDSESWLHYNYHRYYDPETGRYLSSDPIGLNGGPNRFAYAGSNSVNFVDPLGLQERTANALSLWLRCKFSSGPEADRACGSDLQEELPEAIVADAKNTAEDARDAAIETGEATCDAAKTVAVCLYNVYVGEDAQAKTQNLIGAFGDRRIKQTLDALAETLGHAGKKNLSRMRGAASAVQTAVDVKDLVQCSSEDE